MYFIIFIKHCNVYDPNAMLGKHCLYLNHLSDYLLPSQFTVKFSESQSASNIISCSLHKTLC